MLPRGELMTSEAQKVNWWVRAQVLVLIVLLVVMAGYRFAWVAPVGNIDAGLLTVAALAVILILSESFDNFSIGKWISISREVKKKEKEVEKLEAQNSSLISQMISLSNHQAQSQSSTNVYGDYHAAGRVEQATAEEVQESQRREAALEGDQANASPATAEPPTRPPALNIRAVENFAIDRYCLQKAIEVSSVIRDAKLIIDFRGVDGISNTNPIFDGYIRSPGSEVFLEIRPNFASSAFRDRLYMMLSKIDHYRNRSGTDTRLDLIVLRLPSRPAPQYEIRLLEEFRPAISSNRLTVTEFVVTEQQEQSLVRQN